VTGSSPVVDGAAPGLFGALTEEQRGAILQMAVRRRFRRDEVVFHEGDPGDACHVVTRGLFVAHSTSTFGQVIAVNRFPVGAVFGEAVLLNEGARRSATVVAWDAGETLMLARDAFESIRAANPAVDRFLLAVLSDRNRALTEHLVELLFTPVDRRVYRRLLELADHAEDADGQGADVVTIRQSELATLAGTTRATVNRVLRRAADVGMVEPSRGRTRILDRAGLERLAR
jgi:CRP/FNR family cyclic AMP-dependent transcriptional regulator